MRKRVEKKILKREFLRGYITALPKDAKYTMSDLNEVYRKYYKINEPL